MSSANNPPRKALGKGLSALIPSNRGAPAQSGLLQIPVADIDPNPVQPRTVFDAGRLSELAQSIRENGVIQPLVVRRSGERFQLIAGERRWRAAKLAGMDTIPAVVQDLADGQLMQVALIENLQREDLNAIEVAHAFERLTREFNLTHEEIAKRTGKDRTTITNMLRLLRLPASVQLLLAERRLSMGHARALAGLPAHELQHAVAERCVAQGMSVRQVERLVQRMTEPREPKHPNELPEDPNVKAALAELERVLGTRVRIVAKSDQRGRIEIEYYSPEDLVRIYEAIVGN
jgi:ParB family chromosome partitioning protein